MRVYSNCEGIRLGRSLGVAHFTLNTFRALQEEFNFQITCQVSQDMVSAYRSSLRECDIVCSNDHPKTAWLDRASALSPFLHKACSKAYRILQDRKHSSFLQKHLIEYVPHQFQVPVAHLPRVVTCHDLHIFDVPWKYKPREPLLDRFTNNMLTASAILSESLRTFHKLPSLIEGVEEKLFLTVFPTLLEGVSLEASVLEEMRTKFPLQREEKLLIYPSMLQEHKNHKNLVTALSILKKTGRDVRLICPGSDFSEAVTRSIKEHVESLGMCEYVSFPGYMSSEQIRALYELCAAAVSPSLAEAGNAIAQEAIAYGRSVTCADTEAGREHIDWMGATVPMFDPNDPVAMAESIWDVISNGHKHVAANEEARKRLAEWTYERVAKRFAEVFKWVAGGCNANEKPVREAA